MPASTQPSMIETLTSILPMVLVFGGAMWFLSIRPAMKRNKEQEELQKSLKKGDKVLTQAGFFAEVDRVTEDGKIFLRMGDARVEFQRQAIVSKVQEG
ncbi:MAG TPA: preprotein translocase subunit YajC [Fibrobacteria bacterium]|nr:preprotein translocase subunit YajC [Fibrobacteria bacterium]HOX52467.1 preprotein translocase subunit YajC [Fibrobacteria bacterium]